MTFEKTTFEKPIPISPAISLDRERCILCYRCTRFSETISEDGQLVARNRGAMSVITTFEDEPYSGPFTGNVTELCPVGALLPTQYRFEARPWEIVNVPTVCGMCPVGCNVNATVREGKVKRILSRNHPEIDEGWICDKGRFGFTHLRAADRVVDPIKRVRRRGFEPVSWDEAIDEAERLLRAAHGRVVVALSGSETVEQAYALGRLVREGLGSHTAMLAEEVTDALDAYRLPLSAIAEANVVAVLGDVPLTESAPVVDLWVKKARRSGAKIVASADEIGDAERVVLIWSGPHGRGGAVVAALAEKLGLAGKDGCGAFYVPTKPNGRGVADAWAAASDEEGPEPDPIGLLLVSGDEAANDANVRALAEVAESVIVVSMFQGLAAGWADLVIPGTSTLERDGTYVNLEGRLQRLRRAATPPAPDELWWLSQLAARFGVELAPRPPPVSSPRSRSAASADCAFGEIGEQAALRVYAGRAGARRAAGAAGAARAAERRPASRLLQAALLRTRRRADRGAPVPAARRRGQLARADARARGIATGDVVTLSQNGASVELRARLSSTVREGVALVAREHAGNLSGTVDVALSTPEEAKAQ